MFAAFGNDVADVLVEAGSAGLVDWAVVFAGGKEEGRGVEVAGVQNGVDGDFKEVGEGVDYAGVGGQLGFGGGGGGVCGRRGGGGRELIVGEGVVGGRGVVGHYAGW